MIRRLLVSTAIGSVVLLSSIEHARADEVDTCANAYESAQRHHKGGDLKTSIVEAQTCARDVCPEILKKDCSQWVTQWRAEEKERAAKEPPPEPKPVTQQPDPPPSSSESSSQEPSRPVPVMTYVLGGVGVLALGGATGFMLNGISIRKGLDDDRCSPACDQAEVDRARTSFLAADILGVAGIAAIAGAIVFYVTRPEVGRAGSVAIIPSAGGASLRATF